MCCSLKVAHHSAGIGRGYLGHIEILYENLSESRRPPPGLVKLCRIVETQRHARRPAGLESLELPVVCVWHLGPRICSAGGGSGEGGWPVYDYCGQHERLSVFVSSETSIANVNRSIHSTGIRAAAGTDRERR